MVWLFLKVVFLLFKFESNYKKFKLVNLPDREKLSNIVSDNLSNVCNSLVSKLFWLFSVFGITNAFRQYSNMANNLTSDNWIRDDEQNLQRSKFTVLAFI